MRNSLRLGVSLRLQPRDKIGEIWAYLFSFFSYLSKFYIVWRGNIRNISTKKMFGDHFLHIISFAWEIQKKIRISKNVINFGTFYFRPLFGAFLVVFGICWRKQTSSKIRFYLLGNNPSICFRLCYWLFLPDLIFITISCKKWGFPRLKIKESLRKKN